MAAALVTMALPAEYPLVGVGLFACFALNWHQMLIVTKARNTYGVKYPTLYVTEAEANADPQKKIYNCIQRSHQNTLEAVPFILAHNAYLGLFMPRTATGFTLLWVMARLSYTRGYATGEPSNRVASPLAKMHYVGNFGVALFTAAVTAWKLFEVYFD